MPLPVERIRPPSLEIIVLGDAVRSLLARLDRRHVDLSRLDRDPAVSRVTAALHCAELAAERWHHYADPLWLGSRCEAGARVLLAEFGEDHIELARELRRAGEVLRAGAMR
jgi:hypothetical protein